jgi:ATP-dependent Clp protease ATP-binding subunit ClpC
MCTYSDEAVEACVKLSERYISDRFFPDKAIDVMDEVGARTHLKNIHVPKYIEDLEKEIESVKEQKNLAVKSQQYERAADLRDQESNFSVNWNKTKKSGKKKQKPEDIQSMKMI